MEIVMIFPEDVKHLVVILVFVENVKQDLKWWVIDVLNNKSSFHIVTSTIMKLLVKFVKMGTAFSKIIAFYPFIFKEFSMGQLLLKLL